MTDREKIAEFGEMVETAERLSDEISRPWKVGCAALGAALAATWAAILWENKEDL